MSIDISHLLIEACRRIANDVVCNSLSVSLSHLFITMSIRKPHKCEIRRQRYKEFPEYIQLCLTFYIF